MGTVKFPDLVMLACNSLLHADVLDKNSADCRRVLELLAWILALTSTEKPKVPVILRPQEAPPRPPSLPPLLPSLVLPSWPNPRRPTATSIRSNRRYTLVPQEQDFDRQRLIFSD